MLALTGLDEIGAESDHSFVEDYEGALRALHEVAVGSSRFDVDPDRFSVRTKNGIPVLVLLGRLVLLHFLSAKRANHVDLLGRLRASALNIFKELDYLTF